MPECFTIIGIYLAGVVGFSLGSILTAIMTARDVNMTKVFTGIIFALWVVLTIYGMVSGKWQIPFLFDVFGFTCSSMTLGMTIGQMIELIKGKNAK